MITEVEYNRRVEENTDTLIKEWATYGKIEQWSNYHFINRVAGTLNAWQAVAKYHDIIVAIMSQTLPYFDMHGADGFRFVNGNLYEIEYKTVWLRRTNLWQGPSGGLYSGLANNGTQKSGLESSLQMNYKNKPRDTICLLIDEVHNEYVDMREIPKALVADTIESQSDTKPHIKWRVFDRKGVRVPAPLPLIGWNVCMDNLRKTIPVLLTGERVSDKIPQEAKIVGVEQPIESVEIYDSLFG